MADEPQAAPAAPKKRRYRCYNPECGEPPNGYDFASAQPICPKCGADKRTPSGRAIISPLTVVHLVVPAKDGPIQGQYKNWAVLCDPKIKLCPRGKYQMSGEPSVTNCPACLAHADFPADFDDLTPELVPNWRVGEEIVDLK